jgi:hypothetical protein
MTYQNINLALEDILGLLKGVMGRASRSSSDLVEPRGKVGWRVRRLGADRVEISCGSVLALGKGNELRASALDDGERNELVRHWT